MKSSPSKRGNVVPLRRPQTGRILVVDDEESIREFLKQVLEHHGFECRAVDGGEHALELLESGEHFDVITSDILNDHMDGYSFLTQLKKRFPETPVLLISGNSDRLECINNGAYDYLQKPFADMKQLFFAVERALECSRLKSENRALRKELDEIRSKSTA